jgi:hypothetical protein
MIDNVGDSSEPMKYSLSAFEKPKDVKRFAITNIHTNRAPLKIALGTTEPCCGLTQRTRERIKSKKNSHVDWWLYENSEPHIHFKLIEDFEKYFFEYNKEKEGDIK